MLRSLLKTALAGVIVWLTAGGAAKSQVPAWGMQWEPDSPTVFVDHAFFLSDNLSQLRLELYYQVYHAGLEFTESDDGWVARYKVATVVRDSEGRQVTAADRQKQIRVNSEIKTRSRTDHRTSQFAFDLPEGKYEVEFTLSDLTSRKVVNRDIKVHARELARGQPTMSDIEFAQAVGRSLDSGDVFGKGDLQVVPSVARTFVGGENGRLLYYMEIYRGADSVEQTVIETRLRHDAKGMIYRDTLHLDLTQPRERQLREISLYDFPPGHYDMEIYLRGRRNKKLAEQNQEFEILWTHDALIKFDWKKAVDQLSYIAEPGGLDYMKKLESVEDRKRAFREFWQARDETVGTAENEVMIEFYRRVAVTNQRFSVMKREGWRTDRGRIYIKFGEPDELDDFPYSPSRGPYQIWHYYMSGVYRRFTFVDDRDDGDYRLLYPYDGLHQTPDF